MARNRVIYQSEALYVTATGTHNATQLERVQSANYSFEVARTDVNQFGELAAIDRIIVEQPTVSLDFSYYPTTGHNESQIGLNVGGESAIQDILDNNAAATPKNYFIGVSHEGKDYNKLAGDHTTSNDDTKGLAGIIGIGNGFLTSYSAEGSVGELLSASVNVEALNMAFESHAGSDGVANTGINHVLVNPADGATKNFSYNLPSGVSTSDAGWAAGGQDSLTDNPAALRHGDMDLSLSIVTGVLESDLKVQNFTMGFELSRENLEKIGSKFAFSKEIEFPTTATMDVSAIVGDLVDNDNLANILCSDPESNASVTCNKPVCAGATATVAIKYTLKGAKLDSLGFSSSIGDNKSVDMTWSAQIGSSADTTHGMKIENV
jgi:hypothetical protein